MTSINPALLLVLLASYYSQNYAGILASPLAGSWEIKTIKKRTTKTFHPQWERKWHRDERGYHCTQLLKWINSKVKIMGSAWALNLNKNWNIHN